MKMIGISVRSASCRSWLHFYLIRSAALSASSSAASLKGLNMTTDTSERFGDHECLIAGAASVTRSRPLGMENEKVAPGPSLGSAQRRP
jgi:hypothetical protein